MIAVVVTALVVTLGGVVVIALRVANRGDEPEGQNWWIVAWFVVSVAYSSAGAAMLARSARRRLGMCFVVVGAAALVTTVGTQYRGYRAGRVPDVGLEWLADASEWAQPLGAAVLVGLVPWCVLPGRVRSRPSVQAAWWCTAAMIAVLVGMNAVGVSRASERVVVVLIDISATAGLVALAVQWWQRRSTDGDPLAGWLLAGCAVAWLAVVPYGLDFAETQLPGRDVIWPLLLLATVPLLVAGTAIGVIRDIPTPFRDVSHQVVEWMVLALAIVTVYTGLVAGLGRLIGGSGPTWLLVAATGALALALEPFRHRIRKLVDHAAYGDRDDPLAVVQGVVNRLGAETGDDLLPALAASLQRELRLTAVAIDVRVADGWERAANIGAPAVNGREVLLHHHDELVGRVIIGWDDGPSLRHRDDEILDQLVGPLSLAVGWVRLNADLRRSTVAIVSAREEERRRIRRDLHDGLGPTLTGVSLGLRTAVRQLARVSEPEVVAPAQLLDRVADEVDGVVLELRRIVRDLRPTALDQLGLVEAVSQFTRSFSDDIEISLAVSGEPLHLPAAVEVAIYRIVTEAVTNVVRHAKAARCWLTIASGSCVEIDVVDDGIGIGAAPAGFGVTAMRERASELGGTAQFLPNTPTGTRVHVELPVVLP